MFCWSADVLRSLKQNLVVLLAVRWTHSYQTVLLCVYYCPCYCYYMTYVQFALLV